MNILEAIDTMRHGSKVRNGGFIGEKSWLEMDREDKIIYYCNDPVYLESGQCVMRDIRVDWIPEQEDLFANDWTIVET